MISRATHNPRMLYESIDVDLFAGGGGASIGIEQATGRSVAVAVNHDPRAVAMHRLNHPHTLHLCQDVYDVDPVEATAGRRVARLWVSPDCTHHSKARGGKPIRDKRSRELAWVVPKWSATVRPDVIYMENVEEFADWGPLTRKRGRVKHPRPCRFRKSKTFNRFVGQLEALGYAVEWRELRACDYGVPTIRKRLFLVARCDGQPIVWPEVTHGKVEAEDIARQYQEVNGSLRQGSDAAHQAGRSGCRDARGSQNRSKGGSRAARPSRRQESRDGTRISGVCDKSGRTRRTLKPYRTAASCIDFDLPCPSIFMTAEQARAFGKATGMSIKRPLARNTEKRIVAGLVRYVIDAGDPFIVRIGHTGSNGKQVKGTDEPLTTVTTKAEHCLIVPSITTYYGPKDGYHPQGRSMDEPIRTQTTENRHALISPTLIQTGYGERQGQAPRVPGLHKPLGTVVGTTKHAVVSAFMARHFGGMNARSIDKPLPTTTARGTQNQLVAAALSPALEPDGPGGGRVAQERACAGGDKTVNPCESRNHGGQVKASQSEEGPAADATRDAHRRGTVYPEVNRSAGLTAAHLTHMRGTNKGGGGDLTEPARTITSGGNHAGLVAALLAPYYGSGSGKTGRDPRQPAPTVTTKERLSLITAALEHAPAPGGDYCELPAGFYRVWKLLIDHLGDAAPLPIVVLDGRVYLIVDVGMRMLQPRELYNAQGFPPEYVIDHGIDHDGERVALTKTEQVRFCGNSVCPGVVAALVRANVPACEREAELEGVCA